MRRARLGLIRGLATTFKLEFTLLSSSGKTYHVKMQFGGTVLYVDDVSAVVDFYRRAFGLGVHFWDQELGFAELETGGSLFAIAAHSLGEMLMGGDYSRPVDGQPAGVEIAFLTDDVPSAFDKAVAQGASPITAPRRMPWGLEVAYVRAPEGTVIGFSEPPPKSVAGK
jgi:lactoylglutathione lyase